MCNAKVSESSKLTLAGKVTRMKYKDKTEPEKTRKVGVRSKKVISKKPKLEKGRKGSIK